MSRTALPYDDIPSLWQPDKVFAERSNLDRFIGYVDETTPIPIKDYDALYDWSCHNPGTFYSKLWDYWGVLGVKGHRILVEGQTLWDTSFFPDATVNYAENILSSLERRDVIIHPDIDGKHTAYSVKDIHEQVSCIQQALRDTGIKANDTVVSYGLTDITAIELYLATASLGGLYVRITDTPEKNQDDALKQIKTVDPDIIFLSADIAESQSTDSLFPDLSEFNKLKTDKIIITKTDTDKERYARLKTALSDKTIVGFDDFIMPYHEKPIDFFDTPFAHPLYVTFVDDGQQPVIHSHGGTLLEQIKEHCLHCNLKERDNVLTLTHDDTSWFWSIGALLASVRLIPFSGDPFNGNDHLIFDLIDGLDVTTAYLPQDYISTLNDGAYSPKSTHKLLNLQAIFPLCTQSLSEDDHGYILAHIKEGIWASPIQLSDVLGSSWHTPLPLRPSYAGLYQGAGLALNVSQKEDSQHMICLTPPINAPVQFWNDPNKTIYKNRLDSDQYFIIED